MVLAIATNPGRYLPRPGARGGRRPLRHPFEHEERRGGRAGLPEREESGLSRGRFGRSGTAQRLLGAAGEQLRRIRCGLAVFVEKDGLAVHVLVRA